MSKTFAIIGAGPSGFYAAEALIKKLPECRVDIIDRLPNPYGLIRAGVAPDHQGTKNVARQFERTLNRDNVRFLGNVEIGKDLSYDELKANYDAVLLAIGAPIDRNLGIPGEDKAGVFGAAAFVGWYNGHPDCRDLPVDLNGAVAVIGNGNVAVDVARVLVKTKAEMGSSDTCAHALDAIEAAKITDVYMLGRRGPVEGAFTPPELSELGKLEEVSPVVDGSVIPDSLPEGMDPKEAKGKEKNLNTLRDWAAAGVDEAKPKKLHIRFYTRPVEILGDDKVTGIKVERTEVVDGRAQGTGDFEELPVSAVVSAIGYRVAPFPGLPVDEDRGIIANDEGLVEPGVYAAGWAKRGPQGTIPTNRKDSMAVADRIVAELSEGSKPGCEAIDALLAERTVRIVTFADWQKIEAAEVAAADGDKPREKFTRVDEMLAVLG